MNGTPRHKTLNRLSAGFRRFRRHWYCEEHNIYEDLLEGQSPHALVIATSDSRVDPALILYCRPGDLFVIRNVANLVPPYSPDSGHHGVSAALEYAVRHLRVDTIIVMGHSHCGGIAHLMTDAGKDKNEFLSIWMRVAQDARAQADARCPDASAEQRERACEQWAIRLSLRNLRSFPWIRTAEIRGELGIHGWYFDLASGTLLQFDEGSELFIPLGDSYANEASETETAE